MREQGRAHLVYLLQLWRGEDYGPVQDEVMTGWRASLTDPETRTCRRFSSLVELFAYIEKQVSNTMAPDG